MAPLSQTLPVGEHHALAAHEVVLLLETDPREGLSETEARRRLQTYGPNTLPRAGEPGSLVRFVRQLHHPLVYVLLVAGTVTALLGDVVDSVVIFGVVLVNTLVGFIQESRAAASLEALRQMVGTQASVRRAGASRTVPSEDVVPGDLVLVQAGDKLPADLRLLDVTGLQVDESALTGESAPVAKDQVALDAETPVSDRRNMVYSGTLVTRGQGVGVAVATGAGTELGEIHRLVGAAEQLATPLTRRLGRFSKTLTVVILAVAALTFGLGLLRGEPATEMFHAAVALAVGAIPEGLPAAVTITLAIGVARMARRGAVVRRLPAVETLGSTTVICTDKTGTLTQNQMTVRRISTPARRYEASGGGYDPAGTVTIDGRRADLGEDAALDWCLRAGALCNDATMGRSEDGAWHVVGDPTEGALLTAATKAGLDTERLRRHHPRLRTIPFSSERQHMATVHAADADSLPWTAPRGPSSSASPAVVVVKGAAERVLDLCASAMGRDGRARRLNRAAAAAEVDHLAGQGLRVLAMAVGTAEELTEVGSADGVSDVGTGEGMTEVRTADGAPRREDELPNELILVGLQAMLDPPRPAAVHAVRSCHDAGIDVKMITGDHAVTAAAVARQVGIGGAADEDSVVTGPELASLSGEDLAAAVQRAHVFARVSPEQKLTLVSALQAHHHVVAMTGDGVNDAPALRKADIGVAMGRAGTEVAKEAADMVLTDDDFATIEAAVEEGRGVVDNLTKFLVWTLPTNVGEGMVILVAILGGLVLPVLPVQILWINMTTAIALGLMLAFEPKEAGIMARPPRDPRRPMLTGSLIARVVLVSALLVGGALWLFHRELAQGVGLAEARTAALNLFVVVEAFYLFSCRSLTRSVWRLGLFTNRWLLAGVAFQAVAQWAITYLPGMNDVFGTAPIDLGAWLRIVAVAVVVSCVVAVDKRVRRGRI